MTSTAAIGSFFMDGLTSLDALPWLLAALAAVLALAVVLLLVLRARDHRDAAAERERTHEQTRRLSEQLAALERRMDDESRPVRGDDTEHVITRLGEDGTDDRHVPQRIEGRLFADIVARETVVLAASWTHGVRRALAPETRNRIRFHMRQETKRARKERRAEMKEALRVYRARQREDARERDEDAA